MLYTNFIKGVLKGVIHTSSLDSLRLPLSAVTASLTYHILYLPNAYQKSCTSDSQRTISEYHMSENHEPTDPL